MGCGRFNLSERKRLRDFCGKLQPSGVSLVSLLLNETAAGARFWNLLFLVHLEVDGVPYLFGVPTQSLARECGVARCLYTLLFSLAGEALFWKCETRQRFFPSTQGGRFSIWRHSAILPE